MNLLKHCFSVLYILIAFNFAGAQTGAEARTDSNYAETGNPFVIHLAVPQSAGQPGDPDFSAWADVVPGQNILQQTDWTPKGQTFNKDLTLIFFDEDTLTLPPLPVRLNSRDTALTNPLDIVVVATPAPDDLVNMRGIKDILREPALWTDYLPWAIAIAALVLLVLLASWLIGRAQRKKKHATASRSVGLPPHELALKKLDVLAQKQLWNKGLIKDYCAELTFILREYLEKRYGIPALESASEEMLEHLSKTGFPGQLLPGLHDFFSKADLVKFAKATPPETFREEAPAFARKVILETQKTLSVPSPVAEQ